MSVLRDPAYGRYLKRFVPLILVYVVGIFLASTLIPEKAAATPFSVGIALIPGLAICGVIWAMARLIIELEDEYLRLLETRKALIATAFILAGCSTLGLLELYTEIPRTPMFFVFPFWCAGLGVGSLVNKMSGA